MPDPDPSAAVGEYDIIVIGAGSAGMPLVIAAAERGGRVLIVERSGQVGGTLHLSGGHVAAAGTRVQSRLGIVDSPDIHFDDVMHLSHGLADRAITRRLVDNAGPVMDWLDDLGFQCREGEPVKGADHNSFSVERYYQGPEWGISLLKAMMPPFRAAVASGRATLQLRTAVKALRQDSGGAVTGVVTEDAKGQQSTYSGRSVVIATGGYCSSPEMFRKLTGKPLYGRGAYAHSLGSGIELGLAAGGHVDGGQYQRFFYGITLIDECFPAPMFAVLGIYPTMRMPWEILVNRQGRRFMAEDGDIDVREAAFSQQAEARAWVIFDQAIRDRAPPLILDKPADEVDKAFDFHPLFAKADTIEELAQRVGLPAAALQETIDRYNEGVGRDRDDLGREFLPSTIAAPPFYAVECFGTSIVGFAGLKIDADCQVLRSDATVIRGLYAVGEVTGLATTGGDSFVSGAALTPALTFGRLLGQNLPIEVQVSADPLAR